MTSRRNLFYILRRSLFARSVFFVGFLALVAAPRAQSQTWKPLGPEGGDARALAVDPSRPGVVYLGTTDGHVFGSEDGGRHWQLLGLAGSSFNALVTSIVVDPRKSGTLFASTWTREQYGEGGGIYRSSDGGRNWSESGLSGHAVRALVAAPSDPNTLVAGALDGVFRSRDGGKHWEMITPAGDPELRNFDSLAIDPRNPEIIYAGTFHLPWKTTDGGQDWIAIHDGMIDDSDVLSLAVNPSDPDQIFASACSGIYGSDDAGAHWKRIQGIPDSSRRTVVIRFDAANPGTLYAGTTQGLWKSTEGGARWRRVSPADWVINSLVMIPSSDESSAPRVLIGTEQQGVLVSDSAADDFQPANEGFQHRRVVSLTLDRENAGRLGAVLANASDSVVQTSDEGETWSPLGAGLESGSARHLFSTPDGWWTAVASGGLMRLDPSSGRWTRIGALVEPGQEQAGFTPAANGAKLAVTPFRAAVNDLAFSGNRWFAATDDGLFTSTDAGISWTPLFFSSLALPVNSVRVSADGDKIRIVSSHAMIFSDDAGHSWKWHDLPLDSYGALRIEIADEATLLVTSPTGLYVSRDGGETWKKSQAGLPASQIQDLLVRPDFWAASIEKGGLYLSRDRGANWTRIKNPGVPAEPDYFPILEAGVTSDRIYAGSANESLYLLDLSPPSMLPTATRSGH
jgi:photosystem II stability/assembly factor-like uncharacterized protein